MPIDPDKLLAFPIPEIRQRIDARDAAFYALSIGLGQDPLDERQLAFADAHSSAFTIFPSFAFVAAHPGFWLSHPDSGVDARGLLHAGQSLRVVAPLRVGQTVVSRSRVTRLTDKGIGKAALIDVETRIEDETGELLVQLDRTSFVRGGGGFGGENVAAAPSLPVSDEAPNHVVDCATRPEQALYYRMNGDPNPLHSDPATAARAGFDRPILHGLCTAGIVCHAVLRTLAGYDATRLVAVRMRFAGHVLPGETIRTEIRADGGFRARVIERDAIVIDGGMAEIAP